MKVKVSLIGIVIFIVCATGNFAQQDNFPVLKGPYLGQKPPGMTPELFAPGIISTGYDERCAAFSANGKEFYYCLWGAPQGVILYMREVDGRWTEPEVAAFSGGYPGEVTMSPRDDTIFFSSKMPFEGSPSMSSYWAWKFERTTDGQGTAKPLGPSVNFDGYAAYPYAAKSGDLYFFSNRAGGFGSDDIYLAELVNGQYSRVRNLGAAINTDLPESDPCIAPDGSFLIFCRWDKVQITTLDLYISFRAKDGSWTTAIKMGETINSDLPDFCPSITPDGKYLFFTSERRRDFSRSSTPITYAEKMIILNSPGNGSTDIYWVDAKIIERLRPRSIE